MTIREIIIGVILGFAFLLLIYVLKSLFHYLTNCIVDKLGEAGNLLAKRIDNLGDIKIEMVTNGSDTTTLPFPPNAANCSHLWEPVVEKTLENDDIKKLIYVQKCTMCGLVDKTIEEITKDRNTLPKSECRHQWTNNTVALDSAFEQMRSRVTWTKKDMKDFEPWFFRKTLVKVLICSHCGETQTVIASNFDLGEQNDLNT